MNDGPRTNHDWTVHAINIHGVFFERWCQQVISDTDGWRVASTNYPVSWPPPEESLICKESNLDIRAELRNNHRAMLTVAIECKKNNPDFTDWIFFLKHPVQQNWQYNGRLVINKQIGPEAQRWMPKMLISGPVHQHPLASEARETKGTYSNPPKQNQTKTSNAAITEASYQIALATQAIFAQECSLNRERIRNGQSDNLPYERNLIVPAIVTTARLFICDFDPTAVDPHRGEIPFDKVTLTEQPFLFYEYPLPSHLQALPTYLAEIERQGAVERFVRLPIMVIQSASLGSVLQVQLPLMLQQISLIRYNG